MGTCSFRKDIQNFDKSDETIPIKFIIALLGIMVLGYLVMTTGLLVLGGGLLTSLKCIVVRQ